MKSVATVKGSRVSAKPCKRFVSPAPEKVTGIYRFSVMSEKPFFVDIGRRFSDVRSLEVFHGLPMYLDSLTNVSGVDFWGPRDNPVKFSLRLKKGRSVCFRITADEVLPEQLQLEDRMEIGSLNTRMPYDGLWRHIRKMREERNPRLKYHFLNDESSLDVNEVVASSFAVGVGGLLVIPFVLSVLGLSTAATVMVSVSCDPWRTYINGRLYKNLKEIRVQVREGNITGYMTA
jgi:hypothetical protein